MTKRLPFWIYLLGVFPLAYWQAAVRASLGDWLSFAVVVGYLLALRLLGYWAVRLLELRRKSVISEHNLLVERGGQRKKGRKP
jgi:hypothetical protein